MRTRHVVIARGEYRAKWDMTHGSKKSYSRQAVQDELNDYLAEYEEDLREKKAQENK